MLNDFLKDTSLNFSQKTDLYTLHNNMCMNFNVLNFGLLNFHSDSLI